MEQPTPNPETPAPAPAPTKPAEKSRAGLKLKIVALVAALFGMAFGGVIEYFVQGAMDATGWFGPTIETVAQQQLDNFKDIRAKLDALARATPGSPEALKLQGELDKLLTQQEQLTGVTHTELKQYQQQIEQLKAEVLRAGGSSGTVDFWLKPGEGITVCDKANVFALTHIYPYDVAVNASGTSRRLKPGDVVEFPSPTGVCKVIYKHHVKREDGRVGFDLVHAVKAQASK